MKQAKKQDGKSSIGKRKKAVARGIIREGGGQIFINSVPLEKIGNMTARMLIEEPLKIAGDAWKAFSIKVTVTGGGVLGQAQAARQAIARLLVKALGGDLKKKFMEYDKTLLVYDSRRTEPHKYPHSSWGPRRYKQRSKR